MDGSKDGRITCFSPLRPPPPRQPPPPPAGCGVCRFYLVLSRFQLHGCAPVGHSPESPLKSKQGWRRLSANPVRRTDGRPPAVCRARAPKNVPPPTPCLDFPPFPFPQ